MGLDQYAYKVKREHDYEAKTETITKTELDYWRKHNALEGWMANLYQEKTEDPREFNCKTLQLTSEDLDNLEQAVTERTLPETVGFFFGSCTKDNEEYRGADLDFIKNARKAIAEAYEIEYTSWW